MKCFVCGKGFLRERVGSVEGEFKNRKYTVETPALVCNRCGHTAIEGEHAPEYMRRLADAHRRANDLLTSDEIRGLRAELRMSQDQFAEALGVGPASVKRWEHGLVQDRANNNLMLALASRARRRYAAYEYVGGLQERVSYLRVEAGLEGLPHGPPGSIRLSALRSSFLQSPKCNDYFT